jgi:hypothetical protein
MTDGTTLRDGTTRFWRVHCHIGHHPGQWQYWFREQCCAVGWRPPRWQNAEGCIVDDGGGHALVGNRGVDRGWAVARKALQRMRPDDWIAASLPRWRVGRIGRIVKLAVGDVEWDPIIRPTREHPYGENGRRILVRWDLTSGPDDPSKVVLLPEAARWNPGHATGTIRELPTNLLRGVLDAMKDEANWMSIAGTFSMEVALSDYISVHPGRLEAGMIAHPSIQARELTFSDKTRADVILQDRAGRLVLAECKQTAPSLSALEQIDRYRRHLTKEFPEYGRPRALLVHGGAHRVLPEVNEKAAAMGIELVYFELQVNFFGARHGTN